MLGGVTAYAVLSIKQKLYFKSFSPPKKTIMQLLLVQQECAVEEELKRIAATKGSGARQQEYRLQCDAFKEKDISVICQRSPGDS